MAHKEQEEFILYVRNRFPFLFQNVNVLDIGSLDINGSIRKFFYNSKITGIDLASGPGVDIVCDASKYEAPNNSYDVVVSCECFEHNENWKETFINMHRMSSSLVIVTCATTGRAEHGTTACNPQDSPFTNNYYKNLVKEDFPNCNFRQHEFITRDTDLYFWGLK